MMKSRPSVFIGSSGEGTPIAQAIQVLLDRTCQVEIWNQGVFGLMQGTLESLVLALTRFDFAVLVLTADDLTTSRDKTRPVARDNVIFELGLFVGGLGRERTFMIYDRSQPPALPSDLAGITAATYEPHDSGNLQAALGAASTLIQQRITQMGRRENLRLERLGKATSDIEHAGQNVERLIRLLARSRKVELDIISGQFGAMIPQDRLREMLQDLEDLETSLGEKP